MTTQNKKPLIGISIGDLNGIGLEVIIKTFLDTRMLNYCTPIIYGSQPAVSYHKNTIKGANFNFQTIREAQQAKSNKINMINCWMDKVNIELGKSNEIGGEFALRSLSAAVQDLVSQKIDGLVTAPIDKKAIQSKDFNFPGHTEYLMNCSGSDSVLMMMVSENMKLALVSAHVPFSEVSSLIKKEKVLEKIEQFTESLKQDFLITKPNIAVLGLNPHAGENGMLGMEEIEEIIPAIEAAKEKSYLVNGPYPADGFFGSGLYKSFDGTLAMYHDQGLIPFKTLCFNTGVNYTAGLPVVRTSPDHGTAYAIAGKNQASESSFREAVFTACKIIENRKLSEDLTKNPLESKIERKKEI